MNLTLVFVSALLLQTPAPKPATAPAAPTRGTAKAPAATSPAAAPKPAAPTNKPAPAAAAPKPSPAPTAKPALTTDEQKAIYALGLSVYESLRPFAMSPEELELLKRGISDAAAGNPAAEQAK